MDGEQINLQDFISPICWLVVLSIILEIVRKLGCFKKAIAVFKWALIGLIVVCVLLFVGDLRALFLRALSPDQQHQFNVLMEVILSLIRAILPLLVLGIVMWIFITKMRKQ